MSDDGCIHGHRGWCTPCEVIDLRQRLADVTRERDEAKAKAATWEDVSKCWSAQWAQEHDEASMYASQLVDAREALVRIGWQGNKVLCGTCGRHVPACDASPAGEPPCRGFIARRALAAPPSTAPLPVPGERVRGAVGTAAVARDAATMSQALAAIAGGEGDPQFIAHRALVEVGLMAPDEFDASPSAGLEGAKRREDMEPESLPVAPETPPATCASWCGLLVSDPLVPDRVDFWPSAASPMQSRAYCSKACRAVAVAAPETGTPGGTK